jgi:type I restriction enzyme S subunit
MNEHVMVPLGQVLTIDQDEIFLKPTETYRTAGVLSFGKGIFERAALLGSDTAYASLYRLHENQFVLSRLNGWEGAIDVVSPQFDGCLVSSEYPTFAIDTDRAYPGYLRWVARWPRFWEQLAPRGSMVRRKRVKPDQLLEVEIPLGPVDEQRLFSMKLDRIWAYTAELAELLTQAAITTTALGTSISARPDLHDTVKTGLGWRRVDLNSVMQLAKDYVNVTPSASYQNLGIYSFGRGLFAKSDIEGSKTSAKILNRVHTGQFIYSRLFAFEGAYGFVPPEFDGYFVSNEFPAFDTDPEQLDARWLASYLRSPDRWIELASSSKGLGVRRQRVPIESLSAYKVWLPPIEQQRAMARISDALDFISSERRRFDQCAKSLVTATINRAFATLT